MSWLVVTWAVLSSIFTLAAVLRLTRTPPRPAAPRVRRRPPVLLLRPCDSPTPLELENFAAPIDYPGELTHVVVSPFRPRLQSANVRWLPSDPLTTNRKVGHLGYALAALPRDPGAVVLCVDADVRVDGALVCSLVEALRGGAALASAAPQPSVVDTLAGRAVRGLLVQSHHSFRALDVMSAGAKTVCGKALALGPEAQAELARLGSCIGEDLELSLAMHERGLPVVMTDVPAQVPQSAALTTRMAVERFTRWMQVLRAHRAPLFPTVPLFFAPTPVLMVLAVFVATPAAAAALFVHVALRITLAGVLDRRPGWRFEWLLGELLLLGCWLEALRIGRTVVWRGRRFSLGLGGQMQPSGPETEASFS